MAMWQRLTTSLQILKSSRGATAAEYAVLISLIALVIFFAVAAIGPRLITFFQPVIDTLS